MMRKLRTAALAVCMAATALIAPVVTAPAAHAVETGSVTIYQDHNNVGALWTWAFTGGCANGRQLMGYLRTYDIQRVSAIRVLAGGRSNDQCNELWVRSASWDHPYYGACIRSFANGYNFGQGYNDNVDAWILRNNPNCHNYY